MNNQIHNMMKISFIIFIVLSTLITLSSCKSPAPVRDTDGNVLRYGTHYHIKHGTSDGGGLTSARGDGQMVCHLEVALEVNDYGDGPPASFVPANPNKDGIILESTDLNIKFEKPNECAPTRQTPVWRVDDNYNVRERRVSLKGVLGRPGRETINNWFKIQKYEDHYKIVYCPSVCKTCKPNCADVGFMITNEGRRRSLVLNNIPLKFRFKKA